MIVYQLFLLMGLISIQFGEEFTPNKNFLSLHNDLIEDRIFYGMVEYETSEVENPLLKWAITQITSFPPEYVEIRKGLMCSACSAIFKYFLIRVRLGIDRNELVQVLVFICTLTRLQNERVCKGLIELNIDTFIFIIKERPLLTEQKICSIILQNQGCFKEYRSRWNVYVPERRNKWINKETTNGDDYRILHLTDVHVDPLYQEGANAVCNEPVCCQKDQINVSVAENKAGKWGDFRNCDMPFYSLQNLLEQVTKFKKQENLKENEFAYVYFTGDIISHRIWDTSKEGNIKDIEETYKLFSDAFGTIPVFSILGNHEPHPLNLFSPHFAPDNVSTKWIFEVMLKVWSKWLPSYTKNTIMYGGYYTVIVKPGFRIISLNSNLCYIYNWWLLYDDEDPFHQLHWLSITLLEAESNNEVVHILSHVPPGEECLYEWTRQYRRIIERFSHIIKAQFNGHTHWDELRIFYSKSNSSQVINVAYVGGSFTTFVDVNPNYRLYTVNSESHELLDFDQWTYKLDLANQYPNSTPEWYKLYSFKEAYGLDGLKNADFEKLVIKLARNQSLLNEYYRYKIRESKPGMLQGCNETCRKANLCDIVTTEVDDKYKCNEITSLN